MHTYKIDKASGLWLNASLRTPSQLRIDEACTRFIRGKLYVDGLSPETVRSYRTAIRSFSRYTANAPVDCVNETVITEWLESLGRSRKISRNTQFTYIIGMRQFLIWLTEEQIASIDPNCIKPIRRHDGNRTGLEPFEVEALLNSCNNVRERLIILMLYTTGLRVAEFCSLNRSDVKGKTVKVVGKGGKSRVTYTTANCWYLLQKYLDSRDDNKMYLVLGERKRCRVTPESIRKLTTRLSAETGIYVSPHILRHSFARRLVINGCSTRVVQKMLGHATLASTERYTKLWQADLQDQYDKYF